MSFEIISERAVAPVELLHGLFSTDTPITQLRDPSVTVKLEHRGRCGVYLLTHMNSREHQMIESLAYCIYLAEGRSEGRALQHWLEAQELVEVEELVAAESSVELIIFADKAVEEPESAGMLVESSQAVS